MCSRHTWRDVRAVSHSSPPPPPAVRPCPPLSFLFRPFRPFRLFRPFRRLLSFVRPRRASLALAAGRSPRPRRPSTSCASSGRSGGASERLWSEVLTLEQSAEAAFLRADQTLETSWALAGRSDELADALGEVTYERLLAAERTFPSAVRSQLEAHLRLYDPSGRWQKLLAASASLRVVTQPTADVRLRREAAAPGSPLLEVRAPARTPLVDLLLPAGTYQPLLTSEGLRRSDPAPVQPQHRGAFYAQHLHRPACMCRSTYRSRRRRRAPITIGAVTAPATPRLFLHSRLRARVLPAGEQNR